MATNTLLKAQVLAIILDWESDAESLIKYLCKKFPEQSRSELIAIVKEIAEQ